MFYKHSYIKVLGPLKGEERERVNFLVNKIELHCFELYTMEKALEALSSTRLLHKC